MFVFFKQKTAYEMRISDWSSDVCSSDLGSLDPKQAEYVDDIHGSGLHLLDLINDILDLSKVDAGVLALREEVTAVDEVLDVCEQIGSESCRESVCPYVSIPVVAVSLKIKPILI